MPPRCLRRLRVAHLVGLHLRQHGARALVLRGQALEMLGQMRFHLALGLDHEAEAQRSPASAATAPIA